MIGLIHNINQNLCVQFLVSGANWNIKKILNHALLLFGLYSITDQYQGYVSFSIGIFMLVMVTRGSRQLYGAIIVLDTGYFVTMIFQFEFGRPSI